MRTYLGPLVLVWPLLDQGSSSRVEDQGMETSRGCEVGECGQTLRSVGGLWDYLWFQELVWPPLDQGTSPGVVGWDIETRVK